MPQGASDGDSRQSKRAQNPAYVYGPMVYQFPPDHDGEKEKSKSSQGVNFLVLALIVVLVIGGVILYLKESGIDIRQLGLGRAIMGQPIFRGINEGRFPPPDATQARVAVDTLHMREGPGVDYGATYLLPEDWWVSLLGDYQTDNNGEVWARVLVETEQGTQEGWVSRRYLAF
ncbi:MAG: SH3 domain-containing protein [Blastocatellales bacterium]